MKRSIKFQAVIPARWIQIVDEVNVDEISDEELDHLKDLASGSTGYTV